MEDNRPKQAPLQELDKSSHLNIMNVLDNLRGVNQQSGQTRYNRDLGWDKALNNAGKGLTDMYIQHTNNPNPDTYNKYIDTLVNLRQNIRKNRYPEFNGLDNHLHKFGVTNL